MSVWIWGLKEPGSLTSVSNIQQPSEGQGEVGPFLLLLAALDLRWSLGLSASGPFLAADPVLLNTQPAHRAGPSSTVPGASPFQ
ncbi:hypothetical protein H920_10815 [Fukomys damarensis]|uniref:Uncharacterized protein n=1 Tax=Fukomys damarensis TaxID=885580 RepID=A0A091DC24_FUKDA|nr:hypothetical protein H920_10815 [Fukomys damarensis]